MDLKAICLYLILFCITACADGRQLQSKTNNSLTETQTQTSPQASLPKGILRETSERVRGTRVWIVRPRRFVSSPQFSGFYQADSNASIMVTEMKVPFAEFTKGFGDAAAVAARGMKIINREEIKNANVTGILLQIEQQTELGMFSKWLYATGDANETLFVTATFPRDSENSLSNEMKRSVLSARWDKDAKPVVNELGFTIQPAGDLQRNDVVTIALMFSTRGVAVVEKDDEAMFIASPSISNVAAENPRTFAESRVKQLNKDFSNVRIKSSVPVEIDGLNGYQVIAEANDNFKGRMRNITIHQTMLFDKASYFLMVGIVESSHAEKNLQAFRQMARSFKRTNR